MESDLLKGRVACVTGSSRGIGRAIAVALGRHGATVVGTATQSDGADQIQRGFNEAGIQGWGRVLDVRDALQSEALIEEISTTLGQLDILVNNAGITRDSLLLRMKESDWEEVLQTNLTAAFRLCRLVLKPMIKSRWGRIISIASIVGATGNAGQANYAAAKAGLIGFTKSLAREVAQRNVTVNCIAPGFIETDMTQKLSPSQREAWIQQIPLGRLGTPDEVAHAAAFLASPSAAYLTGQTLHVNGGLWMGG